MTIGNKYISDLGISDSLDVREGVVYLSMYFERAFLTREDIIYLPCLIRSYSYHMYIKDYPNYTNFKILHEKFKAQLRALQACKFPPANYMDFLNTEIIEEFYSEYKQVCLYLYDKHKDVPDYEHLAKAFVVSEYIQGNYLIYDNSLVKVSFNPFTDYGRYGLNANSFNILSLARDKRHKLVAPKDFEFFEFDFNAFEVRVLLAILKINQPKGDLYEVLHNMSDDFRQRDQFKQFLIASLYSKNEHKTVLFKFLTSRNFYQKYPLVNNTVTNIFGKTMDSDEYHLLSRVLQSTAAYILYQQLYELIVYLKVNGLKSKLSFCIHDSVCLTVHKDEGHLVKEMADIIAHVKIDKLDYASVFQMKTKRGENYGEMKTYEA